MKDEDVKELSVSESPFKRSAQDEAPRPNVTRTPPGVWPQVSQADLGRAMRRLRGATTEHVRELEPRVRLVGKTG
ncbi:hypothetical protein F0U62_02610 [Cystobacter fuscus]|uniref:hypothetical protein n=1 Tax=Cystobacter fuscus TaxID=43 RepID=UPI002B2FF75C|nr:hypothetical protein F0U62_02610 [Cystobacter fuscus]